MSLHGPFRVGVGRCSEKMSQERNYTLWGGGTLHMVFSRRLFQLLHDDSTDSMAVKLQ